MRNEVNLLSQCNHKNILKVYDSKMITNTFVIISEVINYVSFLIKKVVSNGSTLIFKDSKKIVREGGLNCSLLDFRRFIIFA
jgi:hypothetical protein